MPQLKLSLGNVTNTLEEGDLSSRARFNRGTFQVLSDLLPAVRNKPVSSLSNNIVQARVGVAHGLSWETGFGSGGALFVHFTPDVQGSITLQRSGDLFRFVSAEDADAPPTVIGVPDGKAYVSLALNVGYEAGVAGEFTQGAFGVGASVDKEQRFRIATHCCVDQSTPVGEALLEAFRRFRLPFHPQSAPEHVNDFCEWEFYGRLALGVNAAAGFRGFFFGGRTRTELDKTFRSETGATALRANPGVGIGVGADVNWDHEDAFRIVAGSTAADKLRLYLCRMDRTSISTTLSASARVFIASPFSVQEQVDALIGEASARAFAGVPEGARRNALVKALRDRVSGSPEILERYIADLTSETNQFLTRLGGVKAAGVTASFERITAETSLMNYEFDLPLQGRGFELAMAGDYREAMRQPGVSLGRGSFVRNELVKRSSLSFEIFDAFRARSVEEFFRKSVIEYAGGGVFQLRFATGKRAEREIFGRERRVEMYFLASAEMAQSGALRNQDVSLNFVLSEANDPRSARQLAGVIGFIAPSSGIADALRRAIDANPKLAAKLVCRIASSAYSRLAFTAFRSPRKPHELPHAEDAANYRAFVEAVDQLFDHGGFQGQGFPDVVEKFADWVHYNITVNDAEGATSPPNRRDRGNSAKWPRNTAVRASAVRDKAIREMIRTYLIAAQAFMNLCEDLFVLGTRLDDVDTEEELKQLNEWLADLISQDASGFPLHFTHPTLMALARRMNAQPGTPRVTATGAAFEVSMDLV
ncbi:MAG: hypothetical protein SFV51_01195 [Bryobacteraceae bacterium]|nr:hypothetical protein [Bryobacteraceae bacterium]